MPNHYLIFLSLTVSFNDFHPSAEDDNNENLSVQKGRKNGSRIDFHWALAVTTQPQGIYLGRNTHITLPENFTLRKSIFFKTREKQQTAVLLMYSNCRVRPSQII